MSMTATSLVKSRTFGSTSRKAVALVLADYCDEAWSCFVGQATLAFEAEVGERTVRRILADLEKEGLIRRERRSSTGGHRTSDRTFLVVDAIRGLPARVAGGLPATDDRLPATDDSPTGQSLAGEPKEEPSDRTTSKNQDVPPLVLVPEDRAPDPVEVVFDLWKTVTGKTARVTLDASRRKSIERALASYPFGDVCDAVRGLPLSEFHMGENDRGKRYDDLANALGNASRIEKFRDLYRNPPRRKKPAHQNLIEDRNYSGTVAL